MNEYKESYMIPKIIHYIWFGGNPLPEDARRCIASWRKYCPDYEIREWNESNFNIEVCDYVKEAYAAKKWAFVSDYARLSVLLEYGGIYMDTDVEVIKPLDKFLELRAFSGFENEKDVPTGIMACERGHQFFLGLLKEYHNIHFTDCYGNYDLTTNVTRITNECVRHGLVRNNKTQTVADLTLFSKDFFCPLNSQTGILEKTDNTHTIHWFSGSWKTAKEKAIHQKAKDIYTKYPGFFGKFLSRSYEVSLKIVYTLKDDGARALIIRIKRYLNKNC